MERKSVLMLLACLTMCLMGCSNETKDKAECADETKTASGDDKTASGNNRAASGDRVPISATSRTDADWCRACVVGPHGFMSCQRATAEGNESRGELRVKAKDKACEDSGFPKEACPDNKVIAISCKGDAPPKDKTAAGKSMLKALKTSGPLILKKPDKPQAAALPKESSKPAESSPSDKKAPAKSEGKSKKPIPVV